MPEPGMGGSQDSRSGSGNSGSSSGGGNQGGNNGGEDRGMSPGRSQAQFGTTEFAGKTPQQAQNEINSGGGSDQAQAVQRAIAAQQAAQAEAARQEQARQAAAAAQARAQAAAQAEAARFAREQSLSQPSPSTNYLSSSPFATGSSPVRGVKSSIGPVPEETLSDFLNARGADFNPVFTADGTIVDNIPGSYDPTKETYEDEGDFLTDNRNFSQSEYERIAGITDTDPFGNNPVAGSSTMFGRGIETVANKLGLSVDKRGNLTKGQQDFIRDNAFDRYQDPFGEAKMFSTMRNFNLSDAEKAEYAKQQQLQQTSTPSRVQTYADRARQLGEDPSRYEQPNTIRSGLSEGDLTTLGPVVGRPRDMSDGEIAARLGLAATPLGIPVAAAEALFGLNRELGIEGQLGPDGKPFRSAEGQGGLGQLFNVATGGAGTKAIDRASQIATGLINPRAGTQSAFDGVDDFGNKPPSFFERMFGGGSGSQDQNFDQGDNGGDSPVVLDPVKPPSDDTSEVIDPALFAQEKYAGLSGPTVFDPTMYLGPNYRRPTFGLGGIPTRNV